MAAASTQITEESTSKYAQLLKLGFRMHNHEAGSGPALILVHGGGPGATGWGNYHRNIPFFAAHFRTIAIDMPQFGKSDPVVINYNRHQFQADAMLELMDVLGIEKASFLGNSSGGQSAMYLCMDHPERVDKLVLMAPGGAGDSVFYPVPTEGDRQLRRNFFDPTPESMRALCETMCYDSSWITDEFIQGRLQNWPKEIQDARRKSARPQGDRESELEKVTAPSLIVWGREDRFNPFDTGLRMISKMPNAELHIFTHCGHWAQYEKADMFNELVLQFLQRGSA
jgi:2,6-dioxo-6-phenylhexa-3-enoate hydrolase